MPNRGLVFARSSPLPGDRCVEAVTSSPTYGSYTGPGRAPGAVRPPRTSPQRASDASRPLTAGPTGDPWRVTRGRARHSGGSAGVSARHGPATRGPPAVHDVDPLVRHRVVSELEHLDPVLPGTAGVADRALDQGKVVACGDPSDPEA
jgi:hypothetical protein